MADWHEDFRLGPWTVSPQLCRVSNSEQSNSVKHKAMAVLVRLADANGEVVTRDEIMESVWPRMAVTDDVLTQSIVELRKAFGDDAKNPAVIETIPRIGFRLVANISPVSAGSDPGDATGNARKYLLAATMVLAVGTLLWFVLTGQETARQPIVTVDEAPSIAVLPFVNRSDDPDNEYFSDGMAEEILNLLARMPGLRVTGRTSSFQFKGTNEDLGVIGQTLGVKTVLEGSVRKSGDQVRITAQLIDVSNGNVIWGDSYDRTMTDIFAVQDDVAAAIIDALQFHVGVRPSRGHPTDNPAAYALFLKARGLMNKHDNTEASRLLRQVVELDPDFAEAHELLAASYWSQAGANIEVAEGFRLVRDAAGNALAIDPDLAFAQALNAMTMGGPRSHLDGIEALARAWREQPGNTAPLRPLIYELTYAGYLREANQFAEQYVTVDPLSPVANYSLGETLYAIGRTSEAMPALQVAYDLENEFARWFVPYAHVIAGRDEIAIPQLEADYELFGVSDTTWVRELVTAARDPATGQSYLDQRIPQIVASVADEHEYYVQDSLWSWYLLFGFLDRYYQLIFAAGPNDQSRSQADVMVWLGTVFGRQGFTGHSRYLEAAELLGLTRIWEHRGPPDFCEKSEGRWVCE